MQLQRLGLAQPGPAAEERRAGRPRLDRRETRRLAGSSLVFQRHTPLLQPIDAVASPPFFKETLCREWNLFLIEPRLKGKLQAFKGVQFFFLCLYRNFIYGIYIAGIYCTCGQNIDFPSGQVCCEIYRHLKCCATPEKKNVSDCISPVAHWSTVKIHFFNQVSSSRWLTAVTLQF